MDPRAADIAWRSGVELVRWPGASARRTALARAGVPRLLVVAAGAEPPDSVDYDEDWIREPFEPADVESRVQGIVRNVAAMGREELWLDGERVLHRGLRTVVLTPKEATVARALIDAQGAVVTRAELRQLLWPAAAVPGRRAVDAIVYRLRRRCRSLGVEIRVRRGEGFVLAAAAASATAAGG